MLPSKPTSQERRGTARNNEEEQPRSAIKALQEALNEDLPVPVKKVKKIPKANKKNKTSADRDEEDKEAEEPSVPLVPWVDSQGGVVPNMADFNTQPADLVPVCNKGRVLVYKNEDCTSAKARAVRVPLAYTFGPALKAMVKKMTTLVVKDDWEMKGLFAVAVEGDEPIEWDNNKEVKLLMEPSTQGSGFHPPPSPSVYSAATPLTISSLAPSIFVSTAGVDTASLTIAQQLATTFSDPALLQLAIMLNMPFSMTPKASGKGKIPQIFARMKAAALVQDQWLELKNAGKWTGCDLNIDELCLLYIRKTNYNTYAKMFENAQKFPILHSSLNDPTYNDDLGEHKTVWGAHQLTKENLAAVTKELQNKKVKEERAAEKARLAKEKKSKKASTLNFSLQALIILLSLWLLLGLLPCVAAAPLEDPFLDILFVDFTKVIKSSFGADITLATILMLLFSITNNTNLLNLHGQQHAVPTNTQVVTSWMAAFVQAIKDRLQLDSLVIDDDSDAEMNSDSGSGSGSGSNTSGSSDARSTYDTLFLPTDQHTDQTPKQKLDSFCHFLNLYLHEKRGTLGCKLLPISTAAIQPVLIITPSVMQCSDATCPGRALTHYQCYHDVSKVTLLRGTAVTEFWNYSFVHPSGATFKLTCRHTWKAFVLESIQLLAKPSGAELLFVDNMAIKDLVTAAYEYLGDRGVICSAEGHSCDECCHAFKDVADTIPNQPVNAAALAGYDENHAVPEYVGPAILAAVPDAEAMDVDNVPANDGSEPAGGPVLNNPADVHMISLSWSLTTVPCQVDKMGVHCRMKDCVRVKVAGTQDVEESSGGEAEKLQHDNLEEQKVEEACEQLNAWLGGFQTVLNWMTVSNFDFTMHVLLFLHTQCVIARQQGRQEEAGDESEDEEDKNGVRYGQQEVRDDDD
ncbi:hypothetical protein BDN71DRAFT_1430348 [Pleurotus eryngii]|uniref:Uncharacterized protein n=1 Tax=Pleurotus eryngii TaxID=5323 RepID=A0A9P5ZXQ4_PLEER|nr:hypothetical protein BDN71DRAFT_1430348 [Pleurotus eryngii]